MIGQLFSPNRFQHISILSKRGAESERGIENVTIQKCIYINQGTFAKWNDVKPPFSLDLIGRNLTVVEINSFTLFLQKFLGFFNVRFSNAIWYTNSRRTYVLLIMIIIFPSLLKERNTMQLCKLVRYSIGISKSFHPF